MGAIRDSRRPECLIAREFAHSEVGSTAIDYALVLSILVGGVLLGAQFMGALTSNSFGKLVANQKGEAIAARSARRLESKNGLNAETTEAVQSVDVGASRRMALISLTALVVIGAIPILLRRRKSTVEQVKEELPVDPSLALNLPNKLFEKRQKLLRIFGSHLSAALREEFAVRHLMSPRLAVVAPATSLDDLRTLMEKDRIRHLLVCEKGDALVGIVSDRDVKSRTGRTARDIMTAKPATVSPDLAISPAITMMMNKSISCLPVVESGKLCGILTTTDLMLALQCNIQILKRLADSLQAETPSEMPAPEPAMMRA